MSSTRYCNIHRLLWNDDKFPYVSDDCQLVTLHTFTSNYMTNFGLAQVSVYALAEQKKWGPKGKKKADHNRYLKGFNEGLQEGFYQYDEFNQMIYVPNMKRYNPPGNPNILIAWGKEYNLFPECDLKVLFYQSFKAFIEGFGKAFNSAYEKAFMKPSSKALAKPHVVVVESEYVSEELKEEGKTKNHEVKEFIDYAASTYEASFKEKLLISGPKDGANVKRLLLTYPLDRLKKAWDYYIAANGKHGNWFKEQGICISNFSSAGNISKCLVGEQSVGVGHVSNFEEGEPY